eukprot:131608-Chlamydomonas_euryale.AAC.1
MLSWTIALARRACASIRKDLLVLHLDLSVDSYRSLIVQLWLLLLRHRAASLCAGAVHAKNAELLPIAPNDARDAIDAASIKPLLFGARSWRRTCALSDFCKSWLCQVAAVWQFKRNWLGWANLLLEVASCT